MDVDVALLEIDGVQTKNVSLWCLHCILGYTENFSYTIQVYA